MSELAEKEEKLVNEINARKPTESGILNTDGGLTICEDEDDWKVITLGFHNELETVNSKIKQTLEDALDNGLGSLGIIQRQCSNFNVKP